MSAVTVYLAGGMRKTWQAEFTSGLLGYAVLDPSDWSSPDPAVYTARDLTAIRASDCLVAYMDTTNPGGYGLSVEVGYAYALGKAIVFCDMLQEDPRTRFFGMHRQMATEVCSTVVDAVVWVRKHFPLENV